MASTRPVTVTARAYIGGHGPPHLSRPARPSQNQEVRGTDVDEITAGRPTKQVIVIRRDLRMRRGKEIAQGAHAATAWLAELVIEAAGAGPDGRSSPALRGRTDLAADQLPGVRLRPSGGFGGGADVRVPPGARGRLLVHLVTDRGLTEWAGCPPGRAWPSAGLRRPHRSRHRGPRAVLTPGQQRFWLSRSTAAGCGASGGHWYRPRSAIPVRLNFMKG